MIPASTVSKMIEADRAIRSSQAVTAMQALIDGRLSGVLTEAVWAARISQNTKNPHVWIDTPWRVTSPYSEEDMTKHLFKVLTPLGYDFEYSTYNDGFSRVDQNIIKIFPKAGV